VAATGVHCSGRRAHPSGSMRDMEIRALGPGDDAALAQAGSLFDGPIQRDAAHRFLNADGHHVLIAILDGETVGFVTGVELTHPDKGTEMFLYELGVAPAHRHHGFGTGLVGALRDVARHRGCYGMWVLTDGDNLAALAAYQRAGAGASESTVVLNWSFPSP
jgi:ribosomal protein S18 acetylase RimI-like enzyme